jgi:hypothetical protein
VLISSIGTPSRSPLALREALSLADRRTEISRVAKLPRRTVTVGCTVTCASTTAGAVEVFTVCVQGTEAGKGAWRRKALNRARSVAELSCTRRTATCTRRLITVPATALFVRAAAVTVRLTRGLGKGSTDASQTEDTAKRGSSDGFEGMAT